jgi:Asp-tRNA(Asn)/Glu-tRNA(Gln) amidotransferase A subunit family amidase
VSGFADFEQYDALGLADLVRRRQVTPVELLESAIERVDRKPTLLAERCLAFRPVVGRQERPSTARLS